MNKRLFAAACLIAVALIIGTLSYFYLVAASEDILTLTDSIEKKYLSGENFSEEYSALDRLWEKHASTFAAMLKHSDADTLDRYFMILRATEEKGDYDRFIFVLAELDAYLRVTVHGEAPILENIF